MRSAHAGPTPLAWARHSPFVVSANFRTPNSIVLRLASYKPQLILKITIRNADRDDLAGLLEELVAEGARRRLLACLVAEIADYIERHQHAMIE